MLRFLVPALAIVFVVTSGASAQDARAQVRPPAAVAAASMVPLRRMPLILGLLAAQALACSLLLFTIW